MNSDLKSELLAYRLKNAGIPATPGDAQILRRAEMKLRGLYTRECNGELQRDEMENLPGELNCTKQIKRVCTILKTDFYIQGDCRGCSLYVGKGLTDRSYLHGVACYI